MENEINKAAEEGGLPTPRAIMDVVDEFGSGTTCYISEDLRAAIAADRASRQVANKAQHDIWGPNGEFAEFYVAGFEGREICPTTKGNALAAYSNGIKDRVANKAEVGAKIMPAKLSYDMWRAWEGISNCLSADQMGEIYDAMYEVVPPANKAEVEPVAYMSADGKMLVFADAMDVLKFNCSCMTALYATPPATTGASTVLTNERIAKLWREATDQKHGDTTVEFTNWFARAIEREVAAQAGQVASVPSAVVVPEGFVLMPKRLTAENGAKSLLLGEFKESIEMPCPECDGEGDDECLTCENFGEVSHDIPVSWDNIKAIYEMAVEHLAAPSPAKESK